MTDDEHLIRVVIVDDHPLAREGLAVFLGAQKDLELVGQAGSGREAVSLCEKLQPDIVLMDMAMPDMDGVAATRAVHEVSSASDVIVLTSFPDRKLVKAAFEAGAVGYLLKDVSGKDLVSAILGVRAGRPALAPEAAQALISCAATPADSAPESTVLTKREMQVLAMMAEGLNNVEIAQRLYVSRSTAKAHVSTILSKLGVSTRTEAVTVAWRENLLD